MNKIKNSTFNFITDFNKINHVPIKAEKDYLFGLNSSIVEHNRWDLLDTQVDIKVIYDYFVIDNQKKQEVINSTFNFKNQYEFDAVFSLMYDLDYIPEILKILILKSKYDLLIKKWIDYGQLKSKQYLDKKNRELFISKRVAETHLFFNEYKGRNFYK